MLLVAGLGIPTRKPRAGNLFLMKRTWLAVLEVGER